MMVEIGVIIAGMVLLMILMLLTRMVMGPMKTVSRVVVNCALALGVLCVLNLVGNFVGFHLPMNPVTVVGVGFLGAPGLGLLSVLSFLFL